MEKDFYRIPIPFSEILERKEIRKCDLMSSIRQKIHLLLISGFGENRYNPQFGCIIWDYDFENLSNQNAWKDMVIRSVQNTLLLEEPRLQNIRVGINIDLQEFTEGKETKVKRIKRKLDVTVTGSLVKTSEPFNFKETIYISPISLD